MNNPEIPLNLFQTWNSKTLPPKMKECVKRLRRQNPEFKYALYDDDDCIQMIQQHFGSDVLNAFYRLAPGAYKADLWRYCVLYLYGGIYLDIKFECVKGFKLIKLTDKTHYVMDRQEHSEPGNILVYNGFMVSPAKNPILMTCIREIVNNTNNNEYGFNPLYPTGPGLLGKVLGHSPDIDLTFSHDENFILYHNKPVLKKYPEYRAEQLQTRPGNAYTYLWKQSAIYHP
jgi:mannosyltransferase OCH1-like enzyme